MILCVTPNPAVDRVLVVPEFAPGHVHRTQGSLVTAGGKGINVSRVIKTLGGDPLCLGLLGGHGGRLLADLVKQEGLPSQWTWTGGETRTSIIVIQQRGGESTVLNDAGSPVTDADWAALVETVLRESAANHWVCFCGSLPPGVAAGAFSALLTKLIHQGCEVWVDTSATALAEAMTVPGVNIKVNGIEAATLLGRAEIATPEQAGEGTAQLQAMGAKSAAITLGRIGAVIRSGLECWFVQPPTLTAVSAVGSGDAFLGGWLAARAQGKGVAESARWACAAGAANALSPTSGQLAINDFERLLGAVQLNPL